MVFSAPRRTRKAPMERLEAQQALRGGAPSKSAAEDATTNPGFEASEDAGRINLLNGRRSQFFSGLFSRFLNWKMASVMAIVVLCIAVVALSVALRVYSLENASGPQISLEPCPDDWMYYRKYCYFYDENDASWSTANKSCQARKASLVVFKDQQEMDYILKRAGRSPHWIGLYKSAKGYKWINGDVVDQNKFEIVGDEGCGYSQLKNGLKISLATCSLPMSSICTMEPYTGGSL